MSGNSIFQEEVDGKVDFQNVTFCYPARPSVPVITGMKFTASAGHTVALVGSSGCGKSTSVQLLQRFYDPATGQVVSSNA